MTPQELLNSLANEPEIAEAIAPGYSDIDLSNFFNCKGSVMIGDGDGVMLFLYLGDGTYQMHVLFSRRLRGRFALHAIRHMTNMMFTDYKARAMVASPPVSNRAVRVMARAIGCAPTGHSTDSLGRPCTDYILERETWADLLAASSVASVTMPLQTHKPAQVTGQRRLH